MSEVAEISVDQGHAEKEAASKNVTILQWNVWHKADPGKIIEYLKNICNKQDVDVISLQEVDAHSIQRLQEELNMPHLAVSSARNLNIGERHYSADTNVILSKHQLENVRKEVLVEKGWRFFTEREPSQNYLEAQIQIPGSDKKLTIANTHLLTKHFTKRSKRQEEAKKLQQIAQSHTDEPYVLTGDFNDGADSYAARKVQETPLISTKPPGVPTWTGKYWRRTLGPFGRFLKKEFDHTYISSQINLQSADVLKDAGPSDHHPIITKIAVS